MAREGRLALGLAGLALLLPLTTAAEPTPAAPEASLAARLSDGATAMEYWDVTAWLDSGDRFVARFLVTNQGPGVRTAAAVGHLVLAGGEILPFKWGRRSDAWTLGPGGESLAIAKTKLELGGPAVVVAVDSARRGIDLRLEIARSAPLAATRPVAGYAVDVALPAPLHGQIRTRGQDAPRAVVGTGTVTHTWTERPEGETLRRRVELMARAGDDAFYLSALTLADGSRRTTALATRGGRMLIRADDVALRFGTTTTGGDAAYPVAATWELAASALDGRVTVGRELLRMNPLEILPQPFRMLLALGGQPQRVWAEAAVDVDVHAANGEETPHLAGRGLVAATFARPDAPP